MIAGREAAGMWRVRVRQFEEPLDVAPGDTILEAALDLGFDYPYTCKGGTCGACKTALIAGQVDLKPYAHFALPDAERAQGYILACRALPLSHCEVAIVDPDEPADFPLRAMDARVAALEPLTHDIVRLELATQGPPLAFAAGQYAALEVPGLPPRDYSMANRPGEALVFHVRHGADGTVSKRIATGLKVGDPLRLKGPYGVAYLRKRHRGPILAVAGGSGLAPIAAIVEEALATLSARPIRLLVGVRDARDVYFEEHFRALAARHPHFSAEWILSVPEASHARPTGTPAEALSGEPLAAEGTKAYLAGPPAMVEAAYEALLARGVPAADIHADAFYSEADKARLEAEGHFQEGSGA
jgi:CDP-4-dehydro-6-deoxyglucose reductase/ferredoxin-NAD(P)+ reductase (naphthalene dioxygenase ferredoxin-specific)